MRISDWSSDVCSSDLLGAVQAEDVAHVHIARVFHRQHLARPAQQLGDQVERVLRPQRDQDLVRLRLDAAARQHAGADLRSEEHTSELQSLMRISYAVFCLKKKKKKQDKTDRTHQLHNSY